MMLGKTKMGKIWELKWTLEIILWMTKLGPEQAAGREAGLEPGCPRPLPSAWVHSATPPHDPLGSWPGTKKVMSLKI